MLGLGPCGLALAAACSAPRGRSTAGRDHSRVRTLERERRRSRGAPDRRRIGRAVREKPAAEHDDDLGRIIQTGHAGTIAADLA